MSGIESSTNEKNPFRTQRIRPGAIPFVFPADQNADRLALRLRLNGWWGEIIGPHGSGKSTLLATVIPAIQNAGKNTTLIELHDCQRRLPLDPERDRRLDCRMVLVVDGYEQLSYWSRFRLKRLCRRRGCGLLVTSHDSVGLPRLYRTAVTLRLAEQVIDRLLGSSPSPLNTGELADCLTRHRGDLRETLFELYDLYQR